MNQNLIERIIEKALSDQVVRDLGWSGLNTTSDVAEGRKTLLALLVPAMIAGTEYWRFGKENIWTSPHSKAPFRARLTDEGQTEIDSKAGEGGWGAFATFITRKGDGEVSEEGQANVRLFMAAPAMVQFLEVYVQENGKRGGRYDQLLPAEQQPAMVKRAMGIIAEVDGDAV